MTGGRLESIHQTPDANRNICSFSVYIFPVCTVVLSLYDLRLRNETQANSLYVKS